MNYIYVIQNESREAIAATFSEEIAIIYCRRNHKTTYREIPYINSPEHQIIAIAQPIPLKYLPKNLC